jgi:hypothetical protein
MAWCVKGKLLLNRYIIRTVLIKVAVAEKSFQSVYMHLEIGMQDKVTM